MKQIIFLFSVTFISPIFAINPNEEALFNAAQAGDIKKVEALINYSEGLTYRVSMDIKNKDGDTPLIIAVKKNNTSLVEKILKRNKISVFKITMEKQLLQ